MTQYEEIATAFQRKTRSDQMNGHAMIGTTRRNDQEDLPNSSTSSSEVHPEESSSGNHHQTETTMGSTDSPGNMTAHDGRSGNGNSGGPSCGLVSSLFPSSCRGRAEAFARRLHRRLTSLGTDEPSNPTESSWLHSGAQATSSSAASQQIHERQPRHNSETDLYFDFDLDDGPGSPAEEASDADIADLVVNAKTLKSTNCFCNNSQKNIQDPEPGCVFSSPIVSETTPSSDSEAYFDPESSDCEKRTFSNNEEFFDPETTESSETSNGDCKEIRRRKSGTVVKPMLEVLSSEDSLNGHGSSLEANTESASHESLWSTFDDSTLSVQDECLPLPVQNVTKSHSDSEIPVRGKRRKEEEEELNAAGAQHRLENSVDVVDFAKDCHFGSNCVDAGSFERLSEEDPVACEPTEGSLLVGDDLENGEIEKEPKLNVEFVKKGEFGSLEPCNVSKSNNVLAKKDLKPEIEESPCSLEQVKVENSDPERPSVDLNSSPSELDTGDPCICREEPLECQLSALGVKEEPLVKDVTSESTETENCQCQLIPNSNDSPNLESSQSHCPKSNICRLCKCKTSGSTDRVDFIWTDFENHKHKKPEESVACCPETNNPVIKTEEHLFDFESDKQKKAEEEREDRPQRIRRCSSLKTGKTPPGTPGRKKIVRFADVLGLDLADVRTFLDEIPKIPNSAYSDLIYDEVFQKESSPIAATAYAMNWMKSPGLNVKPDRTLVPLFQQPGGLPTFLDFVRERQVCLENVVVHDPMNLCIHGTVRVRNLDFNKSVHIRYTLDSWRNFSDLQATYVANSCDGFSDKFAFVLYCHTLKVGQRLEFAVRFQCKGLQYWDNNCGANYCFQCLPSTTNVGYIPITSSEGTHSHSEWSPMFY